MDSIIPQKLYRLFEIIGDRTKTPPVQGLISVSRSTWYDGIRKGYFPAPLRICKRISVWRGQDLIQCINDLENSDPHVLQAPILESVADPAICPAEWLWKLANWQVAYTLTSQPFRNSNFPSQIEFTKALSLFVKRLNKDLFGHGADRCGYTVGCAMAIEKNNVEGFHVHGLMTIPKQSNFSEFEKVFLKNVQPIRTLGHQTDIRHMPDAGWAGYMLKSGYSALAPELLIKPSEPK